MNTPNNNSFIDKILNYEKSIFDQYILKRNNLIENLKNLELKNLDNNQLLNLTSDIKLIIDPIKTSISSIDDYFTNSDHSFNNDDSVKSISDLNKLMTLHLLFSL
jgi:hypothetical protein